MCKLLFKFLEYQRVTQPPNYIKRDGFNCLNCILLLAEIEANDVLEAASITIHIFLALHP